MFDGCEKEVMSRTEDVISLENIFRKYTDTQIRIGRSAKVFPSHTDFFIICVSVLHNRDFFVK